MKKIISLFVSFLMLFTITSCKSNDRFMIEGNIDIKSTVKIEVEELKEKIENEDSFILLVSLQTCSSCLQFQEDVLNKFIDDTHSVIYDVDLTSLVDASNFDQKPAVKIAPSIVMYNKGKKVDTQKHTEGNKIFTDVDKFTDYVTKYAYLPKLLTISEETLDTKIESKDSFMLYIGWCRCGDCALLENRILNDYLKALDNDKYIYYLESDKYRKDKPFVKPNDDDTENLAKWNNWINFATKYNFVSYADGKVPTLQYYKDGDVEEMLVYHNDVIKDGVVTRSFFDEYVGKQIDEDTLLSYHDNKAKAFLDKYLK